MPQAVILSGMRTPIGKFMGSFRDIPAPQLGAAAIAGALAQAGLSGMDVDHVIIGQALQAGQGQLPARQAAHAAGISAETPVSNVNKLCLSGLFAIHLADMMVRTEQASVVVAGGMESMSRAPFLMSGARSGLKFGNHELTDSLVTDGLECAFDHLPMGAATERYVGDSICREEMDAFAVTSNRRAYEAQQSGIFGEEIVGVPLPLSRDVCPLLHDEGIRADTSEALLAKLRPAFSDNGIITAGNSSQISDGAAAVVVTSEEVAHSLSREPLARIVSFGEVAGPTPSLLHQPARAIQKAIEATALSLDDIGLIEINEAFAAVAIASIRELHLDIERVNVNGGAIALGHPIGMTGTRLVMTLANEMRRRSTRYGIAGLCGGGGQGDALVLERAS